MSGPTKAGEPSMEEILASIRKIIAEDPSKAPSQAPSTAASAASLSGPAASSTPLGNTAVDPASSGLSATASAIASSASSATSPAASARPAPSFGRLSEALRTTFAPSAATPASSGSFASTRFGQSAPSSPLSGNSWGAPARSSAEPFDISEERSRSIESELDDLLSEPLTGSSALPAGSSPASGSSAKSDETSGTGQWAVWRSPTGKPSDSGAGAKAPEAPAPAPVTPSLGRSGSGFYPSSSSFGAPTASAPAATPSFDKPGRFEPQLPSGEAQDASGFGAVVPKRDGFGTETPSGFSPPSSAFRAPRYDAKPSPSVASATPAEVEPEFKPKPAGAKSGPVVIAAMPSAAPAPPPVTEAKEPAAPAASVAEPPASTTEAVPGGVSVPLPPRTTLFSRPFAASKPDPAPAPPQPVAPALPTPNAARSARLTFNVAKSVTASESASTASRSAPALPMAAAQMAESASALNALAAGLASSNAAVAPAGPSHQQPATAPVAGTPPAQDDAAAVSQGVAPAAGTPRTLEDMVADMVKPMLQKWLTDNMPRIIEKALRSETEQLGGGTKPPGT